MLYAVEDEAKQIDNQLFQSSFSKFKYISFKLSSLVARLAAMYSNKMINVKSMFEILYEAKVDDIVMKDGKESNLEDLLRSQKINKTPLFLVVE